MERLFLRYDGSVKRRYLMAGSALLLAAYAVAQVRGIPASVTSPRTENQMLVPSGIPASVTSLGPRGFAPERMIYPPGTHRNRLGRVINVSPIPLFYGVPYYPVVYLPVEEPGVVQRVVERPRTPDEPQRIILEIRDVRPQPESVRVPKEPAVEAARPARLETPEPTRVATVFIFRDGSRKELKDFAITATELIDLSEGLLRRSPLDSLDRAATLKANAENGREIQLPASASD
jgi:hypothetical protein